MKDILTCVMDIGENMLINGAEVHRVEESIQRMCYALGAKRVDIFIITTSMVATIYGEGGAFYSQTRRVTTGDVNYEVIHRLNKLSRKICSVPMTTAEIQAELQDVLCCKKYPSWLEYAAYSVIAAAFTVFFGGGWAEAVVSLLIGFLVRCTIHFAEKAIHNKIFSRFFSSLVATALAYVAHRLHLFDSIDTVLIGNIMTLIPGTGLTNAFRDLFTGDSISGLLRTVEAALTALAIAAGYFLVALLGGAVL
ncbi:MAG: threonine/serine exporter family protein [Oscillospiraceae bacterium]|nr:threonine/serine exporter family protein [Oscillospiraceae bacterium]